MLKSKCRVKKAPANENRSFVWKIIQGISTFRTSEIAKISLFHQLRKKTKFSYLNSMRMTKIFTNEEEIKLIEYIFEQVKELHLYVTKRDISLIVYQYARVNGLVIPLKWHEEARADKEWLTEYYKRFKDFFYLLFE